uniref:Phosphate-starvation-inducible E-like protein n=1 Tax=Caldimicrobium thiodismutans TaxID=1653476 RepID=A0A832LXQ7_9BACT
MNFQARVIKLYQFFTKLAFNITVIILIFSIFVGLIRTILDLGLVITEATVRLGFKDLVTNVLSVIILLELVRAFVDYFEHERVRAEILVEIIIAFVIREFMIYIFAGNIKGWDIIFWSLGILSLVIARTLAVIFKPQKKGLEEQSKT